MRVTGRIPVWLLLVGALLCWLAGWAARTVAEGRNHVEPFASIAQLRSAPARYAGRRVRLAGRRDECFAMECSICPETMTERTRDANACLELSFRPLVTGTGFGSDEQEQVFRFSSVILTADFDPQCLQPGHCVDRQVALYDAAVVAVLKRRANALGLWIRDPSKLIELEGSSEKRIREAAVRAGLADSARFKAFSTTGPAPQFVVCSTLGFADAEPGPWPKTFEGALYARSTLDFYRCHQVRQVDGQMVVQVNA